ncbi:MAG: GNAT family N-acetyltransferase [Deltaproteobacteria bacterium]|nr:GNAT family N-acetyltransferase [Deltaproteobacteria bacterium]
MHMPIGYLEAQTDLISQQKQTDFRRPYLTDSAGMKNFTGVVWEIFDDNDNHVGDAVVSDSVFGAEVSISVFKPFQRKGFGKEALKRVCQSYVPLYFKKIHACITSGNSNPERVKSMLHSCSFRHTQNTVDCMEVWEYP